MIYPNAQIISSLEFDGVNDQANDTGIFGLRSLPIQGDQPFSFSVWLRANSPAQLFNICGRLDPISIDGFTWVINTAGKPEFILRSDALKFISMRSDVEVVEDVWEFWVITYNGDNNSGDDMVLYRNAIDVSGIASGAFFAPIDTVVYGTRRFRVGATDSASGGQAFFFDGNMNNFMQYNYLLSPSDVKVLYNGGSVQGPRTTGFPTSDQGLVSNQYARNLGLNVSCTTIGGNWFGNRFLTTPFWGGSGFDFTPTVTLMNGVGLLGLNGLSNDGPPV